MRLLSRNGRFRTAPSCRVLPSQITVGICRADAELGHILGWQYLRQAWLDHKVLEGPGMSCEVTPTVYSDWVESEDGSSAGWVDSWSLEIDCDNKVVEQMGEAPAWTTLAEPFAVGAESDADRCERVLGRAYAWDDMPMATRDFTQEGDVDRVEQVITNGVVTTAAESGVDTRPSVTVKCGWGPEDVNHNVGGSVWESSFPGFYTRYNAARSFYSFVLEWENPDPPPPPNNYDCGAMLLPHRDGVATYNDAERWELGALPSSRCEVAAGEDSIDVGLYVPRPPQLDLSPYENLPPNIKDLIERRLSFEHARDWGRYPDHAVHFAVYVTGMPAGHGLPGSRGSAWGRRWER